MRTEPCGRCHQVLGERDTFIELAGARYHVRCVRWSEFAQWMAGPPAEPNPVPEVS